MAIHFWVFFLIRRQNVRNFGCFFFGMSPDVPTKVCVFTSDFWILNWSEWILEVDIVAKILLTLLTFIALLVLWKISTCLDGHSLVWAIIWTSNLNPEEWSMDNNVVSKIWVEMSTKYKYSFSHNSNLNSHYLQKCEGQYIRTHTNGKLSKISTITLDILPFRHKNSFTKLPFWVLKSLYFSWWNIRCTSKWFIPTQRR